MFSIIKCQEITPDVSNTHKLIKSFFMIFLKTCLLVCLSFKPIKMPHTEVLLGTNQGMRSGQRENSKDSIYKLQERKPVNERTAARSVLQCHLNTPI